MKKFENCCSSGKNMEGRQYWQRETRSKAGAIEQQSRASKRQELSQFSSAHYTWG